MDSGGQRKKGRRLDRSRRQALLIRALDHEMRRDILRLLGEAEEPVSPVKIAKGLGQTLSNISYHVGALSQRSPRSRSAER